MAVRARQTERENRDGEMDSVDDLKGERTSECMRQRNRKRILQCAAAPFFDIYMYCVIVIFTIIIVYSHAHTSHTTSFEMKSKRVSKIVVDLYTNFDILHAVIGCKLFIWQQQPPTPAVTHTMYAHCFQENDNDDDDDDSCFSFHKKNPIQDFISNWNDNNFLFFSHKINESQMQLIDVFLFTFIFHFFRFRFHR